MKTTMSGTTKTSRADSFNINKLQAAACIVSSAAVSCALIYWAIQSLF